MTLSMRNTCYENLRGSCRQRLEHRRIGVELMVMSMFLETFCFRSPADGGDLNIMVIYLVLL